MAFMAQGHELFGFEAFTAEKDHSINLQGFKIPAELSSLPPLNLSLRKTPSFLNLLKSKLSKDTDPTSKPVSEKLKASNIPATFIKIGSWQQVSRNEADLVAKCYFSKKKLVWEILTDGLKSKIEIRWSNISAIRASFSENQPEILEIELDQAPAFYSESNPQPKKHTIWHVATDFTGGQASMHRRHYVRFPPGTLDRHYEKLLESDRRLLELSKKGFPLHESRYFDWAPYYEDNSYYYCFSNNKDDTTMDMDMEMKVDELSKDPTHRASSNHIQTPQWTFQPPLVVEDSSTSPMSGSLDDTLMSLSSDQVMDSILSHQANYIDTITSFTEQWFATISDEQTNAYHLCLLSSRICDENGDGPFGFEKAFFGDELMDEDSLRMNWY